MITTLLDPKNDIAFKKIFGSEKNKDILVRFINDMLAFRGGEPVVEVTIQNNVLPGNTVEEKTGILDVLCEDSLGHFYIVEMQVAGEEHFGKRAEYYTAKKYGNQLLSGSSYGKLKPIVFLGILKFNLFSSDVPYKSNHRIFEESTFKNLLTSQAFVFLELPKFSKKLADINENSTMIEKWACFFKYAPKMGPLDWEKMTAGDIVMRKAYFELSSAYWSREELDAYDDNEKKVFTYNSLLYDREAKGRAEGEAKGEAKGKAEAKAETARKLLAKGFSIADICDVTGFSTTEVENLKK